MEFITLIQIPGWTSPSPARSLLTFVLLHTDGGVGEDTGVSLQGVVIGAVIILILEGAVLTSLLCGERGHCCKLSREGLGEHPVCTHTEQSTQEMPHTSAPSSSHVTFLQLLHHLDLELAGAAVPFQVACPPGLAADTVPDAVTHSLEALGRGGVGWSGTPPERGRTQPERQSWRGRSSSQSQGKVQIKKKSLITRLYKPSCLQNLLHQLLALGQQLDHLQGFQWPFQNMIKPAFSIPMGLAHACQWGNQMCSRPGWLGP